jgi:16S rRNA (cytosine967-C5)-methyltransferase
VLGGGVLRLQRATEPDAAHRRSACRVAAFLRRHPQFSLEAAPAGLLPPEVLDASGCLVLLPFRHNVDGAFAARLRRAG